MCKKQPFPSQCFITEPERNIALAGCCDVLVAGGGPAGFAAAVSAARRGAKTILLEKNELKSGAIGQRVAKISQKTTMELFEEFYELLRDEKMDDARRDVVRNALEERTCALK